MSYFRFAWITAILALTFWTVEVGAAPSVKTDTSIVDADIKVNSTGVKLTGLASGSLSRIETSFRRSDGWFWHSEPAAWMPEEAWQKAVMTPMSSTWFTWEKDLFLPPANGERLLLLARAVGTDNRADPTPAGLHFYLDNQPPAVVRFDTAGPAVTPKRTVDLIIDVPEAGYMRLSGSLKGLTKARKTRYSKTAKFKLPGGAGLKKVYAAFYDESGNSVVTELDSGPVRLDFKAPSIKRFFPEAGAKSVRTGAPVSVEFAEDSGIDTSSISNEGAGPNFYLTSGDLVTSTSIVYDVEGKAVSLLPVEPLTEGAVYTVHLGPGIRDTAGNRLKKKIKWSFQAVKPSPPETKIAVLPKAPGPGQKWLRLEGTALDRDGVNSVRVAARHPNGLYWNSPAGTWTPEPYYNEATLKPLGGSGRRLGATTMGVRWQWRWLLPQSDGGRFMIEAKAKDRLLAEDPTPAAAEVVVDNRPPVVEAVVLQNGAGVTSRDVLDIDSRVSGAASMRFAESLKQLEQKAFVDFHPRSALKISKAEGQKTVYGQWRDAAGNTTRLGAPGTFAGITVDRTGPKVQSSYPHQGATNVNTSIMVTVNFREESLEQSTINSDTFKLLDAEGQMIEAQVRFDEISRTAVLIPMDFLRYGQTYTAMLGGGIKDRLGNSLGHAYAWTFKTIDVSTHPPDIPKALKVVAEKQGNRLSWKAPVGKDKGGDFNPPLQGGYNVYRASAPTGPFELLNKVPLSSTRYFDKDFERPGRYYYTVRALDGGGSESPDTPALSNDELNLSVKVQAGDRAVVVPANGLFKLTVPRQSRPVNIKIAGFKAKNRPPSPIPAMAFKASRPVSGVRLSLILPGDPDGALLVKKTKEGWLPLSGGSYHYAFEDQRLDYSPIKLPVSLALTNTRDITPPEQPGTMGLEMIDGRPRIFWDPALDPDSGISAYRLFRAAEPLITSADSSGAEDESGAGTVSDITETVNATPAPDGASDTSSTPAAADGFSTPAVPPSIETSAGTPTPVAPSSTPTDSYEPKPPVAYEPVNADKVIDLPSGDLSFTDFEAEAGRKYYYGLAPINGSGLVGQLRTIESSSVPQAAPTHQPPLVQASTCQGCHLTGQTKRKGEVNCWLCHDGTGSGLEIAYSAGGIGRSCSTCHQLPERVLASTDPAASTCEKCHEETAGKDNHAVHVSGERPWNALVCANCHSLHRPGSKEKGYLVNPLNAKETWTGTISEFCLACHGDEGRRSVRTTAGNRQRHVIFKPTGSAPFFPGWAKGAWRQAGHRRAADCLTCHDPHRSPNSRLVAFREKSKKYSYFSRLTAEEGLCYRCHRPGGPRRAADVWSLSRSPSNHSPQTPNRHSDTETAQDLRAAGHVVCADCHNVHEATPARRSAYDGNRVSGLLRGVGGVEPTNGGPGTVPEFTEVYPARREYQICFKCHSSYAADPATDTPDLGTLFNPSNLSYHPVEAPAKGTGLAPSTMVNGWKPGLTMYCSDCHGASAGGRTAAGPHGSKFKPLLVAAYGNEGGRAGQNNLCYVCHNRDVYQSGKKGSRFSGRGGHANHVAGPGVGCSGCHEVHGSTFTDHLIKIVSPLENSGTAAYSHDENGGSCIATCHERPIEIYRYRHAY